MSTTLPQNAVLLLVDVQQAMLDPKMGERNNPDAETNIATLLQKWRETKRPIIHIKHNSVEPQSLLRPELPGNAIQEAVLPQGDEPLLTKNVHSAFIGTDLESRLRENGYDTVVIVGLTTPHCVSTTTRMACDFGFKTYLVADATAAHAATNFDGQRVDAETVHNIALANLHREFATVLNTSDVLNMA
jgi:nicotinamidase-related amidase